MPNSRHMVWCAALAALASCAPLTTLPEPPDAAGAPVEAPPARAEVPQAPEPTATPASVVLPVEPAPSVVPSPELPSPLPESGWDEAAWEEQAWGDWGWDETPEERPAKRKKRAKDGDD